MLEEFLKTEKLFLCWDIAKTYNRDLRKNQQLEKFFLKHIPKIRQCHLHDIIPGFRAHQVIGSGELDFMEFFNQLQEAPIIDYCIEVRPREKARESLRNLQQIFQNHDHQMQQWRNLGSYTIDDEIIAINNLQNELEHKDLLSEPIRAVRQQITYLEPTHFLFFQNIQNIIQNIEKKHPERPIFHCMTITEKHQVEIRQYLNALEVWLLPENQLIQNNDLFLKLLTILGPKTELKRLLVKRLTKRIEFMLNRAFINTVEDTQAASTDRFGHFDDTDDLATINLRNQISALSNDARLFEQHICETFLCHHKYLRHLNIILINIGQEKWNWQRRTKGTDGLVMAAKAKNYIEALTAWQENKKFEDYPELEKIKIIPDPKNRVKEWLVLSLIKTLKCFEQNMQEIGNTLS